MRCRWSSWWTELCCVCACGKDCSIIPVISWSSMCIDISITSSIIHTLWIPYEAWTWETHMHLYTAAYILQCSKTTTKDTEQYFFLVNKVPHGTSPSFQTWFSLCSWKKELDKSKTKHQHYLKSRFEHTQTHLNRVGRWEPLI